MQCTTKAFLDSRSYLSDVVAVHGDMFREQKFHHTNLFVGSDLTHTYQHGGKSLSLQFRPRLLFATSGAANAGIDCSLVRTVVRDGFPLSLLDIIQEMGRAARYEGATSADNLYDLVISWKSFQSVVYRIFLQPLVEHKFHLVCPLGAMPIHPL